MKKSLKFTAAIFAASLFFSCGGVKKLDYSSSKNWAFVEPGSTTKKADVFFVGPTMFLSPGKHNMNLDYSMNKSSYTAAISMQKGLYDEDARFFAPFYRGTEVYEFAGLTQSTPVNHQKYMDIAYADVKDAFEYYLKHYNEYRPVVIASASQGAYFALRLLEDYCDSEEFKKNFIACYAIGWSLTEEESAKFPNIQFATGETDTGVVVSYMSEAVDFSKHEELIKAPGKVKSINPLNWLTDSSPAPKELNLGTCKLDFSGTIVEETKGRVGCYIDQSSGRLKVTDITPEDFPPLMPMFTDGNYHVWDSMLFYRNLQENVKKRIKAFQSAN